MIFSQASTVLTPLFLWHVDAEQFLEFISAALLGLFRNPDGGADPHVGVIEPGQIRACAYVAAHQSQVDQGLDGFDAFLVLG